MLSARRQQLILEYIHTRKSVQVQELSERFQVSLATIRRDLQQMEEAGQIRRVHGGAVLLDHQAEAPALQRAAQQAEFKERIGRAAAELVRDGETIILSSGTTTEAIVPFLAGRNRLTVITNALNIAYQLARFPQITVVVLGGWLRHSEFSLLGHLTEQALQDLRADKVFYGVLGIDPQHGLTGGYLPEVRTDRRLLAAGRELIVVADHTKFGLAGPVRLAGIEAVSTVVTDSEAPESVVQALRAAGITVIQA